MPDYSRARFDAAIPALEQTVPQLMARMEVAGLSLALVADGAIVWRWAAGAKSPAAQETIDTETVFAAASLSKPPFAYAVLKLCENGVLALDTPISHYLSDPLGAAGLAAHDPQLDRITARQVLCHTSGLGNWSEGDTGRVNDSPGAAFRYSGEGYMYLQCAVEYLTGQPLDEHMRRSLFEPLGMAQTSYIWMDSYKALAAHGHGISSTGGHRFDKPWSAFSLHSTPTEYAQILIAMMCVGAADGVRLGAGTLDQMLARHVRIDDVMAWGLGWGLASTSGGDIFWQWGDIGNFQAVALGSRAHRYGLVAMTNSDRGLPLCADLLQAIFDDQHARPIWAALARAW
jgi:CubicO group peptidase (beta-lactamase class C family)